MKYIMMSDTNENQYTLNNPGRFSGITLHTGVRAHITIKPDRENSGITIVRNDLEHRPSAKAITDNVIDVDRATTIAVGDARVHTVEHVLAALYACEIDNVLIEMDGPEPPIADGSSGPYLDLIKQLGHRRQNAKRKGFRIDHPIFVKKHDSTLVLLPAETYKISCTVQYGESMMDTQYLSLPISSESFAAEIAHARTFCLHSEIEELMSKGLIRGGSLDNAVVLKNNAIICKDELRFQDELVRHKILDVIGDLSLTGCRIQGEIIAIKPGHPTNVEMARKISEINGKS